MRTLKVANKSNAAVVYDLSFVNALSTGGVITPFFSNWSNVSVAFSMPTLTVPARGTAMVDVTVTPATGLTYGQYGGYVLFTPQGEGEVYRVPYAGFIGDYQSIQVLSPAGAGFPWLTRPPTDDLYENLSSGATFTMAGNDFPMILFHMDHQARLVLMEVFDAVTGQTWHRAFEWPYTYRDSSPTALFALTWDGFTYSARGTYAVPNGQYVLKMSVLKALGDARNPNDWETWTSPPITIAR